MNLIPDKIQHTLKAWVAALGVIATAVVTVIPSLPQEWQGGLAVAGVVATFVAVYLVPNVNKVLDADEDETKTDPVATAVTNDAVSNDQA